MASSGILVGEGLPSPIVRGGATPTLLALHGFGATPLDVALLCDSASHLGLACHAPLLPGHGTSVADLAPLGFRDWAAHATAVHDDLSTRGPVVVAGLSLGSLLATHVALERPATTVALMLLANAFWLTSPMPALLLEAVDRLGLPPFSVPKAGADIADPVSRRSHLTYDRQPVQAAIEVLRAGQRLRNRLPEVRVPTFIAHGTRDRVCPVRNVERVVERLGTTDVQVEILPRSRHIITRDLERVRLERAVTVFLRRVAAPDQAPVEP